MSSKYDLELEFISELFQKSSLRFGSSEMIFG